MTNEKLDPVLIRKDEHLIKAGKDQIAILVTDIQQIYDLFLEIGIKLSVAEAYKFLLGRDAETVNDFVADKLVIKAGKPDFNGIPIKKEKIREMVEIPDISKIEATITKVKASWKATQIKHFDVSAIQAKDGKIIVSPAFEEDLVKKNSYYTEKEAGHKIANQLLTIATEINRLIEISGNQKEGHPNYRAAGINIPGLITLVDELPKGKQYIVHNGNSSGLVSNEFARFQLDVVFIRSIERKAI